MPPIGTLARRAAGALASQPSPLALSTSSSSTISPSLSALSGVAVARTFSSTPRPQTKTISLTQIPAALVPPYPPGPSKTYKQADRGLYGGLKKQYGHKVSERNNKTRRHWKPNVHRLRLWSDALGCWVKARMTMRAFRTMRKDGGLDEYVLKPTRARVEELGPGGWRLRWLVMQTPSVRERFRRERERLGVPEDAAERVDGVVAAEDVQISLDVATPGALNAKTRAILARREKEAQALAAGEVFELGGGGSEQGQGGVSAEDAAEDAAGEYVDEEIFAERAGLGNTDMASRMGAKQPADDGRS